MRDTPSFELKKLYDDLFETEESRKEARKPKVEEIPLGKLVPFKNHPFQVKDNEEMQQLMKSIADSGVMVPALARKTGTGYELISGHRRLAACKALGMEAMPVIVRELTDDEATITMVDSNLHREHILPSEKAFAYKMKYEAMKHQGTSSQLGTKLRTDELLAQGSGDSRNQVQRYIRLTHLIPEILQMVDEGKIALTPAVELSYLQEGEQQALYSLMEQNQATPSLSQAQRLRKMSQEYTLSDYSMASVMEEVKGNQQDKLKIPMERIRKYFPKNYTTKQLEDEIVRLCEARFRRRSERER